MSKVLNVAIAGLGTVGAEVARQLIENADHFTHQSGRAVRIVAVSARDAEKARGFSMAGVDFCADALALASREDVDVVLELIGGEAGVAYDLVLGALKNGRHVITANKALLAHHGHALAQMAEEAGLTLAAEASVAGGIPVIKMLKESLAGNQITRITGILNGTCNYILSVMQHEHREFADVLAEAQKLGYAEADPSFDIDGIDAAHKLAILAAMGFGTAPALDAVAVRGIRDITRMDMENARDLGCTIRLLGEVERGDSGAISAEIRPILLPLESGLAKIDGALNAVSFAGAPIGAVTVVGPGAGAGATASAVLADVVDLAMGRHSPLFGVPAKSLKQGNSKTTNLSAPTPAHPPGRMEKHFIRLKVYDRPGVLADITAILRGHDISVESINQPSRAEDGVNGAVPVILTTHEVKPKAVAAATAEMAELEAVLAEPVIFPIYHGA